MKTDYKVGDWVEVLHDDADGAIVNKGDKFQICGISDTDVDVNEPSRNRTWCFRYGNIRPINVSQTNTQTILSKAEAIISGQRQTVNGKPERSFEQIAARWSLTVGTTITAQQVALMMVDMKMVRALQGVTTEGHDDHFVDMVGYVALAAELGDKG